MKRGLLTLAVLAAAVFASGALAITYGEPDDGRHPYVGALVGTFSSGTFPYCSGTLISPTVFLTAAHCEVGARVSVTFDEQYTSRSKLVWGTWHQHPGYYNNEGNPLDVAVIVFDKPVKGIAPARLPTENLLSQMKAAGTLNGSTAFTSVGYGSLEDDPPHGDFDFTYPDARRLSIGYFNALGPGYLRISQNPHTGSGGTCYGDSGGPQFLGGADSNLVVSVTVTGDVFCKSTNVAQRIDVPEVRSFLGQFVPLS
ncbi:MAG: trypsin-like serine protease [Gaiellaceae bacterium]